MKAVFFNYKFSALVFCIAISVLGTAKVHAQSAEVVNAFNYLKFNELDKAKTAIDKAILNEKTSILPKTWYYRGLVHFSIDTNKKFSPQYPDAAEVALASFKKASELDIKKTYEKEIKNYSAILNGQFFNKGIVAYSAKDFPKAISYFNKVLAANPNDTSALFNTALAADRGENKEVAKNSYIKLIDMNFDEVEIYRSLANIYKGEKDTASALKVIEKGRMRYSENIPLIIDELNVYLAKGKSSEIISKLEIATQKDPANKTLFFAQGVAYDNMKNTEKAESAYKKALEIDKDYFDALSNLGALYYNGAVETFNKANNLPQSKQKEYEAGIAKSKAEFGKALPYLETSLALNPEDRNTLISLKEIYARTNNLTKATEMKKRLEAIKK